MTKNKKILFIHHNSTLGGAELSFADLVTNLSENITPICALPEGPLQEKIEASGIKTYTVPMKILHRTLNPLSIITDFIRKRKITLLLKKIIRSEQVDLTHMNCFTAAYYGHTAASVLNIPIIWHERDLAKHKFLIPFIAKFAKFIIAISNAVAENLKEQLGDSEKIRVIYNGINTAEFINPEPCDKLDISENKKIVLMASQFVAWKGHLDFIEVASLVIQKLPDTIFILTGNINIACQQNYIQELKNAISALGLDKSFIWTGFVNNMPGLLQKTTCVILPSQNEPFGRIVAEAMAGAKPVVALKSGAVPEIIENNISGCLTEPGDYTAMADNVCRILTDKQFAEKLGRNGKLRVSQNFTIKQTVSEFEKLLKEII